jgi:hypothetical protein
MTPGPSERMHPWSRAQTGTADSMPARSQLGFHEALSSHAMTAEPTAFFEAS